MKILVIGGGGREHALVWKLKQSRLVEKIWCAPGNAGISKDAECLPLGIEDTAATADLAEELGADLTVIGPELPLVLGVADEFARRGLALLGPTRAGARLEGSKTFAKKFMQRHSIPTPAIYGIFNSAVDAYAELCAVDWPLVIKAEGLCAGKGVLVTSSPDEATVFIERVMEKQEFGEAGKTILFEEAVQGQELSYIILTDGSSFVSMAPTRDYKRLRDNDEGPNTGGMGAYSTDDILSPEIGRQIVESVVRPTLDGLRADGISYGGFLYFGLMLTDEGPKVLEFNCRLGDPEAEVIMLRADFDLAEAFLLTVKGELQNLQPKWNPPCAACVVMAAPGYPANPRTDIVIRGLQQPLDNGVVAFHAGTQVRDAIYYTSGGRVVMLSAAGSDLGKVRGLIYDVLSTVDFEGAQYRHDIAAQEIGRSSVA